MADTDLDVDMSEVSPEIPVSTVISSILTSVKKLLGIEEMYEHFDADIIMHINTAFMTLTQLGLGPAEGFFIEDKSATWDDFLGGRKDLYAVRSYVFMRARLMFDPPQMGYLVDSLKKQCEELEWRLNVQREGYTDGSGNT